MYFFVNYICMTMKLTTVSYSNVMMQFMCIFMCYVLNTTSTSLAQRVLDLNIVYLQ